MKSEKITRKEAARTGTPGADPGFFLGGGAPLRNDVTDREVKNLKANTYIRRRRKFHLRGGGAHPLHPPPRSAPAHSTLHGGGGKKDLKRLQLTIILKQTKGGRG